MTDRIALADQIAALPLDQTHDTWPTAVPVRLTETDRDLIVTALRRPACADVGALRAIHDEINALGGRPDQNNSYDQGIVDTVKKALEIIEKAQALAALAPAGETTTFAGPIDFDPEMLKRDAALLEPTDEPSAHAGDVGRASLPLAVRLRGESGSPLPQMVAQRRMQLETERASPQPAATVDR
jgi:hypothetical protein